MNEWTESSGEMNLASWQKPPGSTKAEDERRNCIGQTQNALSSLNGCGQQ